ncbi:hypothetical protein IWT25_02599 [Secundilactobacillus pentosiphilus]|uniref:Uncharacterized protein n=1 Tax=Secundilactobacillus pentosiphilus TaxID=1714682 RepID=A0A1Z5IZN7_9LACO|nr:hypothetical protein [Secundilactobacillus pentosiphilus]GAX07245.1 hypothetical protein IWT25_02599 [Secundilactobacillus pentosiphilus]
MAKLNNATNVLFAALILNGKASVDDVPKKLREGVQAELDFFNDIGLTDDDQTEVENKSNLSNVDTPATVAPKTDNSNLNRTQNDATDQALAEVNDAVKDAE